MCVKAKKMLLFLKIIYDKMKKGIQYTISYGIRAIGRNETNFKS